MSDTNFKIITLLNHQSGVGKTVTAWHLGWKLSEHGKKVLLVDAAPDCGLTRLVLGTENAFEEYYSGDFGKENNIRRGVKAAFRGKPEEIRAVECRAVSDNENLLLLPGHGNLASYELEMRLALDDYSAYSMDENIPGSFYALICRCARAYDIDYVLIDTGAGLGVLNQMFFSISNAFLVPSRADVFAKGALKALKKTLPVWKREARELWARFEDSEYPLPETTPRYLGTILRMEKELWPDIKEYARETMRRAFLENKMITRRTFTASVPDIPKSMKRAISGGGTVFHLPAQNWNTDAFSARYDEIAERLMEYVQ